MAAASTSFDEREHTGRLGVGPETDPSPGWLAYYAFRDGVLEETSAYPDRPWLDAESPPPTTAFRHRPRERTNERHA